MTIRIYRDSNVVLVSCVCVAVAVIVGLYAGWKVNAGYADYRLAAMEQRHRDELASATDAMVQARESIDAVCQQLTFTGVASWYGTDGEHGRIGANGKRFDMHKLTAAAKRLPFGSRWKVTRLDTGESVHVTIEDDGPNVPGRLIDLSYAAGREINMIEKGTVRVRIEPEI